MACLRISLRCPNPDMTFTKLGIGAPMAKEDERPFEVAFDWISAHIVTISALYPIYRYMPWPKRAKMHQTLFAAVDRALLLRAAMGCPTQAITVVADDGTVLHRGNA